MPNNADDNVQGLRPHLSSLVDGELQPLEVIAIQRLVRRDPAMTDEVRDLERLKLAVHMSGIEKTVCEGVRERLERSISLTVGRYARKSSRRRWVASVVAGGAGLAAAAAVLLTLSGPPAGDSSSAAVPTSPMGATTHSGSGIARAEPQVFLNDTSLSLLAAVHRGDRGADALKDLSRQGVLLEFESLPESFIPTNKLRSNIVQASYLLCDERRYGSTLAILDARRLDLPGSVAGGLETSGTYFEVVDGTELRLSIAGDKLFVLMTSQKHAVSGEPI